MKAIGITLGALVAGTLLAGCSGSPAPAVTTTVTAGPTQSSASSTAPTTATSPAPAASEPAVALASCTATPLKGYTVTFGYPESFSLDAHRTPPNCTGLTRTAVADGTSRVAAPLFPGKVGQYMNVMVTPVKTATYPVMVAFIKGGGLGDQGSIDIGALMSGKPNGTSKMLSATTREVGGHAATLIELATESSRDMGGRILAVVIENGKAYPVLVMFREDADGTASSWSGLKTDANAVLDSMKLG